MLLELSRREDWLGVHGRWHTVQDFRVGVKQGRHGDGNSAARLQRHGSVPKELRGHQRSLRSTGAPISRVWSTRCTRTDGVGQFPAPSDPQGYFAVQSMMDHIAYERGMDPVDFAMKNMRRPTDEVQFTNHTLEECVQRGAELFD